MKRKIVNNIEELQQAFGDDFYFDYLKPFVFSDFDFNFDLNYNLIILQNLKHPLNNGSIATSFSSIKHYVFKNCKFSFKLNIHETLETKLTFEQNCEFADLNFNNATIKKNIRFYECSFNGDCDFENTKFLDLVDFWNSTFYKPILFYKTDFLSTTVFSACHFRENVLFTYSLFEGKVIFRGATFNKGLDLSLAINSGEYNFFNMTLNNYYSENHSNEEDYNRIIESFIIPTINKKETFRIIKQHFQSNGDDLEYVKYLKLEKKPIYQIITQNFVKNNPFQFWNYIHYLFDLLSLSLNRISNNHRNSYLLGIGFTIIFGVIFFSLSLLSLPDFSINFDPNNWEKMGLWKDYISFMNPTHDIKLFDNYCPTGWTYFWQTWGRIFVGYGIYQTVQAFRKLK
jgi:hypothetical protein